MARLRVRRSGVRSHAKIFAVGAVVAALLLGACGGGGKGDDATGSDTLKVGFGGEPLSFNPFTFTAAVNFVGFHQLYETLIRRDADGNLEPALATEWDQSEDGLTYTFTLREGVKFHDGTEMTSEDVKFSLERFADPDIQIYSFLLTTLDSVEAPDPRTVVVKMKTPNPMFLAGAALTFVIPRSIAEKPDDYLETNSVGTGPFTLVEHDRGQGFTLERFEDYWGEPAGFKNVDVRRIDDANARVSALRSGQVDFISPLPPQNVEQLSDDYKVQSTVDGSSFAVAFDLESPGEAGAVADERVREAMSLAINREEIVDLSLMGLGAPYGGVGPQQEGSDQVPMIEQDVDRAKQLIQEAGAEGESIKFYVPKNGRVVNSEQVGQAIAAAWDSIGLKTDLRIIAYEEWVALEAEGAAQTYMAVFPDDFVWYPTLRLQSFFACEGSNAKICFEDFDKLITAASEAKSEQEAVDAYVDAANHIQDNHLGIQLYVAKSAYAMKDSLCWEPLVGRGIPRLATVESC